MSIQQVPQAILIKKIGVQWVRCCFSKYGWCSGFLGRQDWQHFWSHLRPVNHNLHFNKVSRLLLGLKSLEETDDQN